MTFFVNGKARVNVCLFLLCKCIRVVKPCQEELLMGKVKSELECVA